MGKKITLGGEFKKQLGWLVFGIPKKEKQTTVYYYQDRPFITSHNGSLQFHQKKRKPRR